MNVSSVSPRLSKRGGFTLVEVLAAVLILSISLLAIITAMAAARDMQRRTVYIAVGRNIAQSRIEQLRAAPIDTISTMAGTGTNGSLPAGNTVATSVSPYPDALQTSLYLVQVTVAWTEGRGVRTIRYETLIARQ